MILNDDRYPSQMTAFSRFWLGCFRNFRIITVTAFTNFPKARENRGKVRFFSLFSRAEICYRDRIEEKKRLPYDTIFYPPLE